MASSPASHSPSSRNGGQATVRSLFVTHFYEDITATDLLPDLEHSCRALAQDDRAGKAWCREHGYRGYTSYASLNDLCARDPTFKDLTKSIDRHVARFADICGLDLAGRRLRLDSLWVNILKPGSAHSAHIHPHSVISGTFYVAVPKGSGALKLEDPRLSMMMAAPPRRPNAGEGAQTFVTIQPGAGSLFLWESWLRHEVTPGNGRGDRISISFNYR